MGVKILNSVSSFLAIFLCLNNVCQVSGGERCTSVDNGNFKQEYCDYGCCGSGDSEYCCKISTSVLVVACVVGGLVLIALISAIVICCYKNYKDKQASRVRRLRQREEMNSPRVRGVEPPKPPSYISAPPAYSEDMPESHFRPQTVSGHVPYNQRFSGTTPVPRGSNRASGAIADTNTSGRHPVRNTNSYRSAHIPGSVEVEAPPPYTEYARGLTPAHRRRRFIRTPVSENTDAIIEQNEINNNVEVNNNVLSEVTQVSETPQTNESRVQNTRSPTLARNLNLNSRSSRAIESRAVTTHASRAETIQENQSRADSVRENQSRESESRTESVIRVLRPSRISRIPTRVGAPSRPLSDVSSRASSISTRGNTVTTAAIFTPSAHTSIGRNPSVVGEEIEDLAII